MVWVDSNYSGEWWDWHVTWNIDDDTGVPQLEDCSDWDLEQLTDIIGFVSFLGIVSFLIA